MIRALFFTMVVSLFIAGCATQSAEEQATSASMDLIRTIAVPTDKYYRENGEDETIRMAIETLKRDLFDPGSAQIRDVRLGSFEGLTVVCGTVNARNRMGGYVGFSPFVSGTGLAFIYQRHEYVVVERVANAGLRAACKY